MELAPERRVRYLNEEARRSGHPVVDGEVIWDEPEGPLYHYYPAMAQVRAWLTAAAFSVEEDVEGPWHEDDHAYHHFLAVAARREH